MSPAALDLVRAILGAALEYIPRDQLSQMLDEEAQKRAQNVYDVAIKAKFGSGDTLPPEEPKLDPPKEE